MLQPRLTNCKYCSTIPVLLDDIDCKLTELATNLYNNIIYSLNQYVSPETMFSLITYKRILTYKLCNPDYAKKYTVEMIASRVKILKFK